MYGAQPNPDLRYLPQTETVETNNAASAKRGQR
jgi:hypothetical protein